MNANGVAIGIKNHGHAARRTIHRFNAEFHALFAQMLDGSVKILDFERGGTPVGTWIEHPRRTADGQRIRTEFVFDPFALNDGRWFQSQNAFVKLAGAFNVRDGVTTKRKFDDFEHNLDGILNLNCHETQFISESVHQRIGQLNNC